MFNFKATERKANLKAAGLAVATADLTWIGGSARVKARHAFAGNGVQVLFAITEPTDPVINNAMVYVNGLLQEGTYGISTIGSTYYVQFNSAPSNGAAIVVAIF